ncbi:hypothetical protein BBF96_04990 [Anoxybacter fermentans]|uniref:Integrase n=1 Tax=Anoxybacter fermentans TaxID=1323375 RepID=A0A3Q9HPL0_9FIRM|nr:tyrosine-type recombinase/integrase [Anoxybacter fermentans]AZR72803.1 hypothetical protein BBF96_04990 [Anoxybacter fermentans]
MDLLEEFIIYMKELEKSSKTIDAYIRDIRQFLEIIKKPIEDIKKSDIIYYKEELTKRRLKPTSINRKLISIRQFLKFLEKDINFRNVKIQKKNYIDDEKMLTLEDVEKLAEVARQNHDRRTLAIIYTLLYTGMRISELLSLRVEDIYNDTILVKGKGKKYRDVFIPEKLRPYLESYLRVRKNTGDKLFTGQRGNLTRATVNNILKKYAKKAGINPKKVHPHNFRHLYCLTLVDKGLPLDVIADLAGHADINTTRIYTRRTKRQLLETINSI